MGLGHVLYSCAPSGVGKVVAHLRTFWRIYIFLTWLRATSHRECGSGGTYAGAVVCVPPCCSPGF